MRFHKDERAARYRHSGDPRIEQRRPARLDPCDTSALRLIHSYAVRNLSLLLWRESGVGRVLGGVPSDAPVARERPSFAISSQARSGLSKGILSSIA